MDGQTKSSHVDRNLRLWDIQKGKLLNEVAAHSNAVTSISLSQSGNMVLTGGRDNVHHLFDMRFPGVSGTLRATGNRVASNWTLSCISPDDNSVPAGSADSAVYIWSIAKDVEAFSGLCNSSNALLLPVLCSAWRNGQMVIPILMTGYLSDAEDALSVCMTINGWELMIHLAFFAGTGLMH